MALGRSGCGYEQSGWALERRGLQQGGLGGVRALQPARGIHPSWFAVKLNQKHQENPTKLPKDDRKHEISRFDCGLQRNNSSVKPSAPPCPAGLDLVQLHHCVRPFL